MTAYYKVTLIWEVLYTYSIFRWRLRREDIRYLVESARNPSRRRKQDLFAEDAWAVARRLNRAIDRTLTRLPTDSRCLIQSIVLCRLLAVRGIQTQVIIGAGSSPDFTAHAWVEFAGRPVSPVLGYELCRLTEL